MTDKSPPAFPTKMPIIHEAANSFPGMSLRDYFAGQVLAGLSAHKDSDELTIMNAVRLCYKMADAMIAERNKND